MNVKIKTVYGELSFNMATDNALALISTATRFASEYGGTDEPPVEILIDTRAMTKAVAESRAIPPLTIGEKKAPPPPKPEARSRIEALFGAKDEWKMPAKQTAPEPAQDTESGDEPRKEEYKGFLYVECEKCGTIKGFCVKHPIDVHVCECGHGTQLHNLRPAHVKCECGHRFLYHTNFQVDAFTIDCLHCGSPVDMELGAKKTAYVAVAFSEMYKERGTQKR